MIPLHRCVAATTSLDRFVDSRHARRGGSCEEHYETTTCVGWTALVLSMSVRGIAWLVCTSRHAVEPPLIRETV